MSTILIVDDDKAIRDTLKLVLSGRGFGFLEAVDSSSALALLRSRPIDLVLLDVHLANNEVCHGILRTMNAEALDVPVIILSGAATPKEAAEAMQLGAIDYLEKPLATDRLLTTLTNVFKFHEGQKTVQRMTVPNVPSDILGKSAEIAAVRALIDAFAPRDVKVLITGESGTGKELVANAIWKKSPRARRPYIAINCAALPENLIESELFGHKKGSFSGAVSNQLGKIELASGGTLFLDEIGELPPAAQVKLLRFLESGEIQPLGSEQTRKCDVRVIAATSRDLASEIRHKRFREDLFYRLNVARIDVPPLRTRRGDAEEIFAHLIHAMCQRYGERIPEISDNALNAIRSHNWPGNVRELKNIAERLVLLSNGTVTQELVNSLLHDVERRSEDTSPMPNQIDDVIPLREYRKSIECKYIEHVLKLCNGAVAKAAEALEVDRSHLHSKLKECGIKYN